MLEPAEGFGVNDTVGIPLEAGAYFAGCLATSPASAFRCQSASGGKHASLQRFPFFSGTGQFYRLPFFSFVDQTHPFHLPYTRFF
jgi:hypothetical protein